LDEIEGLFGAEIRGLVDGVTKLNRLEIKSESSKQAENLPQAGAGDGAGPAGADGEARRPPAQHGDAALYYGKPEKRQRIARETLEIYSARSRSASGCGA
jgi:guanosine-3',5'-bis(diphosphate) 3'-pyrophosphohydrolase